MRQSLDGLKKQRGQGLTEYAVVLSLVALAGIFSVSLLGSSLRAKFGELTGQVTGNGGTVETSVTRMTAVSGLANTELNRASTGMNNRSGFADNTNAVGSEGEAAAGAETPPAAGGGAQ